MLSAGISEGNIFNDVKRTSLIAGAGDLYLLLDRDVLAEHLGLPATPKTSRTAAEDRAIDQQLVAALRARSDAPNKLHPFFLYPNVEGLLLSIQDCDSTLLPLNMAAALRKKLNDRDIVFNEAKKASMRALRDCFKRKQHGICALAEALALRLRTSGI